MTDTEILDQLEKLLSKTIEAYLDDLEDELNGDRDDSYIYDTYRYTDCEGRRFPGLEILELILERDK